MNEEVHNLDELSSFAERVLKYIQRGSVIGLRGELGAGKTTFVRKIVEKLSPQSAPIVRSPSFVLHQRYVMPIQVDHLDFFRLERVDQKLLAEMGYFDILRHNQEERGYLFIEWPEKASSLQELGVTHLLTFELVGNIRRISMTEIQR